ncbi:MAG: hypothetical protein IKF68_08245 [Erysipelotrichaceae bacterium]|nr:hypothetical protein [Erysipelotrichaceae bacterium]
MFKYIITAVLLVIYFEILGQYLLFRINRECRFPAMGVGLLATMAFTYLATALIGAFHGPFLAVFAIDILFIIVSIVLVIKDIRKLRWFFDWRQWVIILVFVSTMVFYAYNTTLGHISSFDSVYYINLISSNVRADLLNMTDLYFGTAGSPLPPAYSMQSYFTFASSLLLIIRKVFSCFGPVLNSEIIIWIGQLIFDFFMASSLIVFFERVTDKKYLMKFVLLFIFLFYFGKLYYNNVYGFYGNTYRTLCTAYSVMYLYDLIKEQSSGNRILFGLSVWGACAFTSTCIFVDLLLMFGSWFVLADRDDELFRYYAVVLFLPLTNFFLIMEPQNIVMALLLSAALCLAVYWLNDVLIRISRIRYFRHIMATVCFAAMFILSYRVTGNIFNFDAFFGNMSEIYDMTIDYFYLSEGFNIRNVYVVFVLAVIFAALFIKAKDRLWMMFWLLIIVFFNPFCCSFLNSINSVYYRAYDIIINPFTLTLALSIVLDLFKSDRRIVYSLLGVIFICFLVTVNFKEPLYYHESFRPGNNYDALSKMDRDGLDIINRINEYTEYYGIDSPYIITNDLFTQSNVTNGRFLFGRDYPVKADFSLSEMHLYDIFKDKEEENNRIITMESLAGLEEYIEDAGIDFIVVANDAVIDDDTYYNLIYYMYDLGNVIYTNDSYSLFMYGH